jgi:hypothetical protein
MSRTVLPRRGLGSAPPDRAFAIQPPQPLLLRSAKYPNSAAVRPSRLRSNPFRPRSLGQNLNLGHWTACPLPSPRPGIQRREGGVGRALLHEHKVPGLNSAGYQNPPSDSQELVAFARTYRPSFGLNPIRLKSLLRVDSLTDTPATPSTKRHLSLSVRAGLFSISASSNLQARSSILGRGPGCFLGESELP